MTSAETINMVQETPPSASNASPKRGDIMALSCGAAGLAALILAEIMGKYNEMTGLNSKQQQMSIDNQTKEVKSQTESTINEGNAAKWASMLGGIIGLVGVAGNLGYSAYNETKVGEFEKTAATSSSQVESIDVFTGRLKALGAETSHVFGPRDQNFEGRCDDVVIKGKYASAQEDVLEAVKAKHPDFEERLQTEREGHVDTRDNARREAHKRALNYSVYGQQTGQFTQGISSAVTAGYQKDQKQYSAGAQATGAAAGMSGQAASMFAQGQQSTNQAANTMPQTLMAMVRASSAG